MISLAVVVVERAEGIADVLLHFRRDGALRRKRGFDGLQQRLLRRHDLPEAVHAIVEIAAWCVPQYRASSNW